MYFLMAFLFLMPPEPGLVQRLKAEGKFGYLIKVLEDARKRE